MSTGNNKFVIKTEIDASGVQPGVETTVSGLQKIENEMEESGVKAHVAMDGIGLGALGNIRSVHHLLQGLVEMGMGGTAAIGGVAAEGRIATEVFEEMLGPLAPIALIITTITMLAAPMIEKWAEHKEKIDDTTKAAEELEKELGKDAKAEEALIKTQQDNLKTAEANFARMAAYGEKVTSLLTSAIDLQKKHNEEVLKGQELNELAQNTGGEAGEAQIRQKYEGLQAVNAGRADEQKNLLAQSHAYGVQQRESSEFQTVQDTMERQKKELEEKQAFIHKAEIEAKAAGLEAGPEGDYKDAVKEATEARNKEVDEYHAKQAAGVIGPEGEKEETGVLRDMMTVIDKATNAAKAAALKAPVEKLKTDIEANQTKLDGLHDQIQEQAQTIENLQRERDNLSQAYQNKQAELAQAAQAKNRELADKGTATKTKGAIDDLQVIADDKSKPAADREKALREIGEANAKELEDKAKAGAVSGPGNLSPEEIDALKKQASRARAEGNDKAKALEESEKKKAEAADLKDVHQQVQSAIGGIEGTGNKELIATMHRVLDLFKGKADEESLRKELEQLVALRSGTAGTVGAPLNPAQAAVATDADAAIASLKPSKQLAKQTHEAVESLQSGHADGARQLEGIMQRLLDTTQNVNQQQVRTFATIISRLTKLESGLTDHSNQIKSLGNGGGQGG